MKIEYVLFVSLGVNVITAMMPFLVNWSNNRHSLRVMQYNDLYMKRVDVFQNVLKYASVFDRSNSSENFEVLFESMNCAYLICSDETKLDLDKLLKILDPYAIDGESFPNEEVLKQISIIRESFRKDLDSIKLPRQFRSA